MLRFGPVGLCSMKVELAHRARMSYVIASLVRPTSFEGCTKKDQSFRPAQEEAHHCSVSTAKWASPEVGESTEAYVGLSY